MEAASGIRLLYFSAHLARTGPRDIRLHSDVFSRPAEIDSLDRSREAPGVRSAAGGRVPASAIELGAAKRILRRTQPVVDACAGRDRSVTSRVLSANDLMSRSSIVTAQRYNPFVTINALNLRRHRPMIAIVPENVGSITRIANLG